MRNPGGDLETLRIRLEKRGYFFNPDKEMTHALLEGLLTNEQRYGYPYCPCRLATQNYTEDRHLICPCDYRDQDINEFGACYCGLYVSQAVSKGLKNVEPIPERSAMPASNNLTWRCKVCGYLCSRPHPPDICPICGVSQDRFEKFNALERSTGMKHSILGWIFLVATGFLLSGCVTLGESFNAELVTKIVPGKTTRAEIERDFGTPTRRGTDDGNPTMTYLDYQLGLFKEPVIRDLYIIFSKEDGTVKSVTFNSNRTP